MAPVIPSYDIVLAVSQSQIRHAFKIRAEYEKCLQSLTIQGTDGSISSAMDPPTVTLCVPGSTSLTSCLFKLNLKHGTFKYVDGHKPSPEHSYTVETWTLAWKVDLSQTALNSTDIPAHIRESVMRPGVYSIPQLLLLFTLADVCSFDLVNSSLPGLPDPGRHALEKLMAEYINQKKKGSHHLLDYNVTLSSSGTTTLETKPVYPTFPSTAVAFQVMPSPDGVQDKNAFLYLEMTGDRTLPGQPLAPSSYHYVDNDGHGSLTVSSNLFINDFVARTTFINDDSLTTMNRLHNWTLTNPGDVLPPVDCPWQLLDVPRSTVNPGWQPSDRGDMNERQFKWSGVPPGRGQHGWDVYWWYGCTIENFMKVSNPCIQFNVRGRMQKNTVDPKFLTRDKSWCVIVTFTWSITLTPSFVDHGVVEFTTRVVAEPDFVVENYVSDPLGCQITHGFGSSLTGDAIKTRVDEVLHQRKFAVSGGSTFAMSNACFTDGGDLRMRIQYQSVGQKVELA